MWRRRRDQVAALVPRVLAKLQASADPLAVMHLHSELWTDSKTGESVDPVVWAQVEDRLAKDSRISTVSFKIVSCADCLLSRLSALADYG